LTPLPRELEFAVKIWMEVEETKVRKMEMYTETMTMVMVRDQSNMGL